MKFAQKTIGFTLIELLVVITIIGILATGGVVTYTSQIQKARDTTRITDIKSVQSGLEQYYQDKTVYPDTTVASFSGITAYVPKIPKDPKSGEPCYKGTASGSWCDYAYDVADDSNGLVFSEYKISTAFESKWNIDAKAATDGGVPAEANRLELGLNLSNANKNTECLRTSKTTSTTLPATTTDCGTAVTGNLFLIVAGNP